MGTVGVVSRTVSDVKGRARCGTEAERDSLSSLYKSPNTDPVKKKVNHSELLCDDLLFTIFSYSELEDILLRIRFVCIDWHNVIDFKEGKVRHLIFKLTECEIRDNVLIRQLKTWRRKDWCVPHNHTSIDFYPAQYLDVMTTLPPYPFWLTHMIWGWRDMIDADYKRCTQCAIITDHPRLNLSAIRDIDLSVPLHQLSQPKAERLVLAYTEPTRLKPRHIPMKRFAPTAQVSFARFIDRIYKSVAHGKLCLMYDVWSCGMFVEYIWMLSLAMRLLDHAECYKLIQSNLDRVERVFSVLVCGQIKKDCPGIVTSKKRYLLSIIKVTEFVLFQLMIKQNKVYQPPTRDHEHWLSQYEAAQFIN